MFSFLKKPIESSPIYNRIKITNNENFTIPETASLFCSGGAYFRNGIAIGNNSSIIPGSMRYNVNNNKLQFLNNEGWFNITGFSDNNCKENSIVKFKDNGIISDTNILIENNDIINVDTIQVEHISPPEDTLKINTENCPIIFGVCPPKETCNGIKGSISYDDKFLYICINDNKWKKITLEDLQK